MLPRLLNPRKRLPSRLLRPPFPRSKALRNSNVSKIVLSPKEEANAVVVEVAAAKDAVAVEVTVAVVVVVPKEPKAHPAVVNVVVAVVTDPELLSLLLWMAKKH